MSTNQRQLLFCVDQSGVIIYLTRLVCLWTIRVHLARDNPNPARAPYLEATILTNQNSELCCVNQSENIMLWQPIRVQYWPMVWQKHISRRKPTQLKRNEVRKAETKAKSVPSSAMSWSLSSNSPRLGKCWDISWNILLFSYSALWTLLWWWIGVGSESISSSSTSSRSFSA